MEGLADPPPLAATRAAPADLRSLPSCPARRPAPTAAGTGAVSRRPWTVQLLPHPWQGHRRARRLALHRRQRRADAELPGAGGCWGWWVLLAQRWLTQRWVVLTLPTQLCLALPMSRSFHSHVSRRLLLPPPSSPPTAATPRWTAPPPSAPAWPPPPAAAQAGGGVPAPPAARLMMTAMERRRCLASAPRRKSGQHPAAAAWRRAWGPSRHPPSAWRHAQQRQSRWRPAWRHSTRHPPGRRPAHRPSCSVAAAWRREGWRQPLWRRTLTRWVLD